MALALVLRWVGDAWWAAREDWKLAAREVRGATAQADHYYWWWREDPGSCIASFAKRAFDAWEEQEARLTRRRDLLWTLDERCGDDWRALYLVVAGMRTRSCPRPHPSAAVAA